VRILATVLSIILHIFFAIALVWLMYARFMWIAPEESRRGEHVVQVEFIGGGTPEEQGGGSPQGNTAIPDATSAAAPPAPPPPETAQPPAPANKSPVPQPLQVTEAPVPDSAFVLPADQARQRRGAAGCRAERCCSRWAAPATSPTRT